MNSMHSRHHEKEGRDIRRLQQAVLQTGVREVELNPVKLTPAAAWVLDALATP